MCVCTVRVLKQLLDRIQYIWQSPLSSSWNRKGGLRHRHKPRAELIFVKRENSAEHLFACSSLLTFYFIYYMIQVVLEVLLVNTLWHEGHQDRVRPQRKCTLTTTPAGVHTFENKVMAMWWRCWLCSEENRGRSWHFLHHNFKEASTRWVTERHRHLTVVRHADVEALLEATVLAFVAGFLVNATVKITVIVNQL